jgi:hypothetical protein
MLLYLPLPTSNLTGIAPKNVCDSGWRRSRRVTLPPCGVGIELSLHLRGAVVNVVCYVQSVVETHFLTNHGSAVAANLTLVNFNITCPVPSLLLNM